VYDRGRLLGQTSRPDNDGALITQDPEEAYPNRAYSSAVFVLRPGSHAIEFKTIQTALGHPGGAGYLRVEFQHAPEPASLILVGGALACLAGYGAYRRRMRKEMATLDEG
jgi:hypothetical protein